MSEVEFFSLSKWQKRDCLFCPQNAVQEARYSEGRNIMSHIRCCTNPGCMEEAKSLAKHLAQDL